MRSRLNSAFDRIGNWFFGPQPIDSLVLARIILGSVLFFCYLGRYSDVQILYGPYGLAGPYWIHPDRLAPDWIHAIATAIPAPSEGGIWFLYALELIAALCFAIGFRTRTAGTVALLVHLVFVRLRLELGYWGWSVHIVPFLFFLLFSRAGCFVSVDAWLAKRPGTRPPDEHEWVGVAWPMRLIQLHTCTMYLVSGGERLDDLGWLEGAAIWYAMSFSLYSKWVYNWHDFRLLMSLAPWLPDPPLPRTSLLPVLNENSDFNCSLPSGSYM